MKLSYSEMRDLGMAAFKAVGVPEKTAAIVTEALILAELDGMPSHGFNRIPFYAGQAKSGKVVAAAEPEVTQTGPSVVVVDAKYGFAFPAIEVGMAMAMPLAEKNGISLLGIHNSHHCGMLGHYVEKAARAGLIGFGFSNSPSAMAPWGGTKASFGTNPLAFGCPVGENGGEEPVIVDMSLSKVARGKIVNATQKGETTIPEGWALDEDGNPTTDAAKALKGTMVPLGDAKGAALALMVEIMSASLTNSHHAFEASSMFELEGPPPAIGQSFIFLKPKMVNSSFPQTLALLLTQISEQPGTRLPGARRFKLREQKRTEGIELNDAIYNKIKSFIED